MNLEHKFNIDNDELKNCSKQECFCIGFVIGVIRTKIEMLHNNFIDEHKHVVDSEALPHVRDICRSYLVDLQENVMNDDWTEVVITRIKKITT